MIDYILEISYDGSRTDIEETILSQLFLTATSGSSASEVKGGAMILAYFATPDDRASARALLASIDGVVTGEADRDRINWLERYEQSLQPIVIGRRFVVVPDPSLIPAGSDRLAIVVPQEQAFGTGSHETTALCIEMLEGLDLLNKRGLDVGAGSGILAMAMLRLGAERAIAFDNDRDAYGALRDNRRRNAVAESSMPIFIGGTDAIRSGSFDVITMLGFIILAGCRLLFFK